MLRTDTGTPNARSPSARKVHPMAHQPPTGLCTTCVHAPVCTYPHRTGQNVLHCAEFEGETLRSKASSATPRMTTSSDFAPTALPLGLCANCALYPGCQYPKAEGGVWQCEEYR